MAEKKKKPVKAKEEKKKAVGEKKAVKAKPKKESKKEEIKPQKSKAVKSKKESKEKTRLKPTKEVMKLNAKKVNLPVFRGRFGKKKIRRKSNEKWSKWRKSRGIDIKRKQEDGRIPRTGYRTNKRIRFFHPSGFQEYLVRNLGELNEVPEKSAVRFASALGRKKKTELLAKASEMNLRIIN